MSLSTGRGGEPSVEPGGLLPLLKVLFYLLFQSSLAPIALAFRVIAVRLLLLLLFGIQVVGVQAARAQASIVVAIIIG